MKHILPVLLLVLVLPALTTAITADVQIQPQEPTSSSTLRCQVTTTATGDLSADITWFVDNTAHTTDDQTLQLTSGVQNTTSEQGSIQDSTTQKAQTWICQATITNTTNTTIQNSSAIEIQNAAPIITYPTLPQTVTEGQNVNIQALANDTDGDDIQYWISTDLNQSEYGGAELFDIQTNGIISFTPTYSQRGNHTMVLSASDGELIGGREVLFTVEIVNQEPRFNNAFPNDNIDNTEEWTYDLLASDREGDPFNFTLVSSELSTVRLNVTSASTAQLYLNTQTPRYEDEGLHEITVAVYNPDNTSQNTTETFTLDISVINERPVLEPITAPTGTQGENYSFEVQATDLNPEDTLQFFIQTSCGLDNPWSITTTSTDPADARGVVNLTLTNDHVVCRNITVVVGDFEDGNPKAEDNQTIQLDILNINDAPVLYEIAQQAGTYDQVNMSELQVAQGVPFTYYVYAEDADILTYESDTLTYTDNTTIFDIDEQTGVISFTPQLSDVGEHLINITVTDSNASSDSRILNLTIYPNDAPLLQPLTNITCNQDQLCQQTLQAFDDDANENLTYTATLLASNPLSGQQQEPELNITYQTYNTSLLSKNFTNELVGEYQYNITVTDQWQAQDWALLNITINNVNDAPFFDQNQDQQADTFFEMPNPIVYGYQTSFSIRVTDQDRIHTPDNVRMNATITGPNTNVFELQKIDNTSFVALFTPQEADIGNYSVEFVVYDQDGAQNNLTRNFSVYNQSEAPQITQVQPYYNQTTQEVQLNLSTIQNQSSINFTVVEPTPVLYNITIQDSDSLDENITVKWYKDDVLIQTRTANQNYWYTDPVGYQAQGEYKYQVLVTDEFFSSSNFTWHTTIQDFNRPPINISSLQDRNLSQATTITNQMNLFYDPDDDTNENGVIDGDEVYTLSYEAEINNTALMQITFQGQDVTITPTASGTTQVRFIATDPDGEQATSNWATYEVKAPEQPSESSSSSGGGGGGGSTSVPVPIPLQQDPTPESIEIIVPEPLSIAYNQTIRAPLTIKNTGERALRTINLDAQTQAENVTFAFSQNQIPLLEPNQEENIELIITNFRVDGSYEILVSALSQDPEVNDTAIIFINSLDQSQEGEATQARVTFARDLLAGNPECLELNELLRQAEQAIQTNQLSEAQNLIDASIQGCRYLISESNRREETPGFIGLDWLLRTPYANTILIASVLVLLIIGGLLVTHYVSAAKKES